MESYKLNKEYVDDQDAYSYHKLTKENSKQEVCDNCNNVICCCIVKTEETLKEATEKYKNYYEVNAFNDGVKWQQEKSYSEEEVLDILKKRELHLIINLGGNNTLIHKEKWFEQFKKK